jgi:hypothetical protein
MQDTNFLRKEGWGGDAGRKEAADTASGSVSCLPILSIRRLLWLDNQLGGSVVGFGINGLFKSLSMRFLHCPFHVDSCSNFHYNTVAFLGYQKEKIRGR